MVNEVSLDIPSIPDYYKGKNIFITGATGFMGKALIEKLLRSCPDIGDIYVLIRPKKGKQLKERVSAIFANPLFDRVKKERKDINLEEKVIPIAGDIIELDLGLNVEDRKLLTERINVIFHVAASVRFDDSLKDSVILNVRSTREVCQLALDCKHLSVHIHVSTAFANCDRAEAAEVLYPQKIDWRRMIDIAEKFDDNTLTALTEKIMDGMPNTYCFTKNIAEHCAYDMLKGRKPCKIFRPSIVVSSMREEPVVGWIDNFNGPVGILVAYGKGIMRTTYAHDQYKPDYIPVDVVTKALIVSAWELGCRKDCLEPEVIQCTSHDIADWLRPNAERLATCAIAVSQQLPLNDILWVPSTHTTTSTFIWYIRTLFCMLIPSLLLDALLYIQGKKPILTKLQRKMFVAQIALRHFMNNEWSYKNDNLLQLQTTIKQQDIPDWDYEFRDFDFNTYVSQSILGCRRYLLKESDDSLPKARKHFGRMFIINRVLQIAAVCLFVYFLWRLGVAHVGVQRIRF